jgi:hypothetical protein
LQAKKVLALAEETHMQLATNALAGAVLALGLTPALPAQDAKDIELPVSAHTDIYRAGGYNDGSDGIAPVVYSFHARPFQTLTFSSVAGEWTCNTSVPEFGADGSTTANCPTITMDTVGTFAGYKSVDFLGAMVGMFLEDALPPSAPPPLTFYVNDSSQGGIQTDFRTLSPKVGQVFFIGDGLTGTGIGSIQVFQVPATATHLYLGYIDACNGGPVPSCYSDNAGSLIAVFRIEDHALDWVEPALSQAPPGRCCAGMAYDYANHAMVLFGGFTNPATLGDTWALQTEWSQLSPAASPSARQGQGMAWDGAAGNIVLFGGMDSNGTYLNDTWTWDGTTWTQQFPPVSPPGRRFDNPSMAYDKVTRTVLIFGGVGSSGGLGDTWTWNGQTKSWTQQFPVASPSARRAPLAYDDITRTVVLFGGDNGGPAFTDTWTWDGRNWTQQFPETFPSQRSTPEMAYDAELGVVVLFGGYGGPGDNLNDTWMWDGTNWTETQPVSVPPGRWEAGMAYDPLYKSLVLFSGFGTHTLDDTWLFKFVPNTPRN